MGTRSFRFPGDLVRDANLREFEPMMERLRLALLRLIPSPVLRLFEGFWATPLILSLMGIGLAAGIQIVPAATIGDEWITYFEGIDVAGTRSALSVIAGGMVSLVTLVFSLTFVALSITAQQLSPRILDFVLRDRSAQLLLGLALSTLLYAAIVLSHGDSRGAWRLSMAMPPALLMSAATLVIVVLFAHRMTRVMRAEELVARLGDEFVADIGVLQEAPVGCLAADGDPAEIERDFATSTQVTADRAGYVGNIDFAGMIEFANQEDLKIALMVGESDFLMPRLPIARVLGLHETGEDPTEAIERALNLTDRREVSHTAVYEAAALCEAALRALSPGINDPATAISCLNRLYEGLAKLASAPPPRLLASDNDEGPQEWRVLRPPREVPEFLNDSVRPILDAGRGDRRVLARIGALTDQLAAIAEQPRDRTAIEASKEDLAQGAEP